VVVFTLLIGFGARAHSQQNPESTASQQSNAPPVDDSKAQDTMSEPAQDALTGSIHGTVVDREGAVDEGALVTLLLKGTNAASSTTPNVPSLRTTASDVGGRFNFLNLPPGDYQLTVSSNGFATRFLSVTLRSGESIEAPPIVLLMNAATSEVTVTASPQEIAQEQIKIEETQRVLGVIPNFYVSYEPNPAPLTTRQKFHLAWRTIIDPTSFLAAGAFAGIEQADNGFSGYGQGMQGYAKRFGASYADSFDGTMIGGAILPSLFKQDPRYFYKGTGTTRSRISYAIASAVLCKSDNGRWQANYSAILGGLAAGGISNLYYPASNRDGAALTFENALIDTAVSAVQNLFQEFVVRKLTPKLPNFSPSKP
jgi:hypothetical protein